ncbi:RluA family pseudouridine synthase [Candidatus Gracilibacteria bacterium]|nr:RluA family pseudouridine synthase [Candidatus Gracilibacteria bacterium]
MKKKFKIKDTENGTRIDILCAQKFPDISRSTWQRCGKFVQNSKEFPNKTKVKTGEVWQILCEPVKESTEIEKWNFPLKVLAESTSWVAIEKPEGISVHPSSSDRSNETVVNALVHMFGKKLSATQANRPGIVHRLDKVTSGVLLVAKNNKTHRALQDNWPKVEKTYVAIVQGIPPKKGRVEAGILRDVQDRQKMSVSASEKSREATTLFDRITTKGNLSFLEIMIPTGRTHQIRVHLSSIGFPILGDTKYGGQKAERVFLHAKSLSFPDPDNSGKMNKVESKVPEEFIL